MHIIYRHDGEEIQQKYSRFSNNVKPYRYDERERISLSSNLHTYLYITSYSITNSGSSLSACCTSSYDNKQYAQCRYREVEESLFFVHPSCSVPQHEYSVVFSFNFYKLDKTLLAYPQFFGCMQQG